MCRRLVKLESSSLKVAQVWDLIFLIRMLMRKLTDKIIFLSGSQMKIKRRSQEGRVRIRNINPIYSSFLSVRSEQTNRQLYLYQTQNSLSINALDRLRTVCPSTPQASQNKIAKIHQKIPCIHILLYSCTLYRTPVFYNQLEDLQFTSQTRLF